MASKQRAKPKNVKNPQTTKSKNTYTSAQRSAYRAAFKAAVKSSYRNAHVNAVATERIQAAAKRAASRTKAFQRRIKGRIVKSSYLQAKYGNQARGPITIPLRSNFRSRASTSSYLQARYGKKTYSLTKPSSVVRLKPRVQKGKIVGISRLGVRKAQTNRTPYAAAAQARNAARRISPKAKYTPVKRKAAKHQAAPDTQWITAGNDEGAENCVAVAVANSALYSLGYRVDDEQVAMVADEWLRRGLWRVWHDSPWWPVDLLGYRLTDNPQPGDIVGFESESGPHCGILLPGNKVVSWGEVIPLESEIEEAWTLTWKITG